MAGKSIHANVVIDALVQASTPNASPGIKAKATRFLNLYLSQKISEGKKEYRIKAAIKACVTRKLNNN